MTIQSYSETVLRRFHAEHAGATSQLCQAPVSQGQTSYELLARLVPRGEQPLAVLDLACGDGPLLELLLNRHQPGLRLVGVDMSPEELDLARRRLGSDRVDLRLERAQELSLAGASMDYVLCHLALMLMDPLEAVVRQIRRVLKPGGLFAAVVQGPLVRGDAMEAFVLAAREVLTQEGGAGTSLGDRRAWSAEGLRGLFCAETGFDEPITLEDFVLHLDGSTGRVGECLSLTYYADLLSPGGVDLLRDRTAGILRSFQHKDGIVPCSLGLQLVVARRAAAGP